MAKGINQKRKLLVLLDNFRTETDEAHPLTLAQLQERLAAYGVTAERKSLYDDLEQLRLHGEDIVTVRDRAVRYYLGQRTFDLPELRLLVDAVQSSKFITRTKSAQLIGKLESLTSRHQAGQLQRQVLVDGRVKTMNESIYYTVDVLHEAMQQYRTVTFQYFDWDTEKRRHLRRDGARYTVSPWALTWSNENYYLIAFDHAHAEMRNYRVDRMLNVAPGEEPREGEEAFAALDMAQYTRNTFGMFGGTPRPVVLACTARMSGIILDRFGQEVAMIPEGEGFRVRVPVVISPQFFAWASGFGSDLTILKPEDVRQDYCRYLESILEQYRRTEPAAERT